LLSNATLQLRYRLAKSVMVGGRDGVAP